MAWNILITTPAQLTWSFHIEWKPEEEGEADKFVEEQCNGKLNHTLERENDTNITWTPLARVYIDFQIWYCCSTGEISDESDCCICYHANQPSLETYIRIGTSPIIYCNLLRMAVASGRVLAWPNFRRSNLHMRFLLAMRGRLCELFIQNCTFSLQRLTTVAENVEVPRKEATLKFGGGFS